jgi:hypothetical protein
MHQHLSISFQKYLQLILIQATPFLLTKCCSLGDDLLIHLTKKIRNI